MDIKWIKITTDIFDDEKILLIESYPDADAIIVIWFKLLCLAGKQNNGGVFLMNDRIPYTDKMLATIFRRKESTVQLALQMFEQFGMIEIVDGVITIPNWEKHQNIDGMERIREQTRERVARHREKQRLLLEGNTSCNVTGNATVAYGNALDKDKNKNKEETKKKEILKKEKSDKRFVPPTVEEVRAYCKERSNSVDAEYFVDYYQVRHWKVSGGKQTMTDWKAAVRTWEHNNYGKGERKRANVGPNGVLLTEERDDSLDAIF